MTTKTQALQCALSDLLDSLYDIGIDEDTVVIAAESRKNRESLHSDVLLQRIVAAKAALALPRRNCDVGTAEEQTARMRAHCNRLKPACRDEDGNKCKCFGDIYNENCWLVWAQMPYEADERGAQ